jgi:hypothetical protein
MTCKSASGECVVRESASTESFVSVHRMPREAPAASTSAEAMMSDETVSATAAVAVTCPTVTGPRVPRGAVMLPAACRPAACAAVSGPTVAAATVTAMSAMMRVARKFKTLLAGKTLAAPPSLGTAAFTTEATRAEATFGKFTATEALSSEVTLAKPTFAAPGKLGAVAGASRFGLWSAVPCRSTRTSSVPRSCARTTGPAPFRPVTFRTTTSGTFPSRFSIRTARRTAVIVRHHAAFAPHFAAIITLAPCGPASRALLGRIPPFGSPVALVEIAALTHPFLIAIFVPAVFCPADIAFVISLVVAPTEPCRPVPFANWSVIRGTHSAATVSEPFVRSTIGGVRIVGSRHAHRVDSPLPLSDELQRRRCRNSSQKHQRVIAHRTSSKPSNAGRFSESTRSPTLATSPAPAP